MEEDLNEDELARLYAMVHYGEHDQPEDTTGDGDRVAALVASTPKATAVRRYWHTGDDKSPQNTPFQKINSNPTTNTSNRRLGDAAPLSAHHNKKSDTNTKPKEERSGSHNTSSEEPFDMSVFQTPISKNVQSTIQILESNERLVVELESSDEDDVIEVALPPKPTIIIESSDEEDLQVLTAENSLSKVNNVMMSPVDSRKRSKKRRSDVEREVSASPVPSVVSSISDEFIRGDCIALNISSRQPDQPSFDFSLHGTDLLDQTPTKKKKKKKNKEKNTSAPVVIVPATPERTKTPEQLFATPKNKSKNKKQKNKTLSLSEAPTPEKYDSEPNTSRECGRKQKRQYTVSERCIPNADVYESDSNQSVTWENNKDADSESDSNQSLTWETNKEVGSKEIAEETAQVPLTQDITNIDAETENSVEKATEHIDKSQEVVDLTDAAEQSPDIHIEDDLVIANVTGFCEVEDDREKDVDLTKNNSVKLGSTKVPAILSADLDFDNLKGNKQVSSRRYSLKSLRADMEKFYNDSWGGEDFNHREIQKYMSRDKSLWAIDPKDRMPTPVKNRVICHYCNHAGHRDDMCRKKQPVCHMCGAAGHYEPRCPRKICVNCGSSNNMYSTICRNCWGWGRVTCAECGQSGHPASHCPDLWRRYHSTVDDAAPLLENRQNKKHYQLFCSGCTRRGHLVHTCRSSLPFSGLPINSPYVVFYKPFYPQSNNTITSKAVNDGRYFHKQIAQDATITSPTVAAPTPKTPAKRQSKSPTTHAGHVNKRRNTGPSEDSAGIKTHNQRKTSDCAESAADSQQKLSDSIVPIATETKQSEPAPDYIPVFSSNHDNRGQIIQDNEVSDTSDVVTTARIYVTKDILDKLKCADGEEWLKTATEDLNVTVTFADTNTFIAVSGNVGDQEAFQSKLRSWTQGHNKDDTKTNDELETSNEINESHDDSFNIPKNKNNALRKLNKAFASLKSDIGDPNRMFKELTYLQNNHSQLLKQKVISQKQVSNNRDNINEMLKKLNMVLLGQAGLAGGNSHLNKLYNIQEKLINYRQKNLSKELRNEIGLHYHLIFSAAPRDDYGDLLKKYYTNKKMVNQSIFKKKKESSYKLNPRPVQKKQFNQKQTNQKTIVNNERQMNMPSDMLAGSGAPRKPIINKTINQLAFFHKKVVRAQPTTALLKKTKRQLVRKLHSHIATLGGNAHLSAKLIKKMKWIQKQAQLFLTNV